MRRSKKVTAISATLAVLISCAMVTSGCANSTVAPTGVPSPSAPALESVVPSFTAEASEVPTQTNAISTPQIDIQSAVGNTPGNLANGGFAAEADGCIYCRGDGQKGIFRMGADGSNESKLSDDGAAFLNVVGNRLFYCNNGEDGRIYSIDTNGAGRTLIVDAPCNGLTVFKGAMYYLEKADFPRILRANLDGGDPQVVYAPTDAKIQSFSVQDDRMLVYTVVENADQATQDKWKHKDVLQVMKSDGSNIKTLESLDYANGGGGYFDFVQLIDDKAYAVYWLGGNSAEIHRIALNNGEILRDNFGPDPMYYGWNVGSNFICSVTMNPSEALYSIAGAVPGSANVKSLVIQGTDDYAGSKVCLVGNRALIWNFEGKRISVELNQIRPQ